jgi:hypothetical protein
MVFIAAFIKDVLDIGFGRQSLLTATIYAGALLVILYGYAWIFATFTEVYTNAVRSRVSLLVPALLYRASFLIRRQIYERIYFSSERRIGSSPIVHVDY